MVEQEARGLAGTGSRYGWSATSMESAASMETMDMEDRAVCMVVQAPPQGGPSSRSTQMVPTQGLEKQESKEPSPVKGKEQCIGNRQVVSTLDTRVDATNLTTNATSLINHTTNRIITTTDFTITFPGSVQDSKVWASGSNILKKPRLYLDEGEFIWVDGGYGHSAITVGPFSHIAANKSRDLRHFNYMLSQVRVQVEHAIAYLKNRFQCLTGYRGNIYRVKDRITAAETIQACIVAHTFASRYDRPADIADLLLPSFSEDEVSEVVQSPQLDASDTQELRRTRRTNQQEYELDLATATQGMSQYAVSRLRSSAAHELREEMFQVLFRSTGRNEEDTTALSRCHEKTTVDYNAMTQSTSARRQERALTQPFSI
ncbi:uncharacterized protein UHOD_12384 [Ustilago sp. UG-2017b]|nr:uncharacterized protein UHOD_12384 [Ustilago sp. UG-2017b]